MKKIIFILLALISITPLAVNAYAQADYEGEDYIEMGAITRIPVVNADKIPYSSTAMNKLDRGIINGATFYLEIPAEVTKVSNEQNPFMGATVGLVKGTVASVARAGTALFDMATFFIPPYDKPVMKPEYAYKRADDNMKEYLW